MSTSDSDLTHAVCWFELLFSCYGKGLSRGLYKQLDAQAQAPELELEFENHSVCDCVACFAGYAIVLLALLGVVAAAAGAQGLSRGRVKQLVKAAQQPQMQSDFSSMSEMVSQ